MKLAASMTRERIGQNALCRKLIRLSSCESSTTRLSVAIGSGPCPDAWECSHVLGILTIHSESEPRSEIL